MYTIDVGRQDPYSEMKQTPKSSRYLLQLESPYLVIMPSVKRENPPPVNSSLGIYRGFHLYSIELSYSQVITFHFPRFYPLESAQRDS